MLEALKSLFDNPQREAKRLNRDAAIIVDSAIKSLPVDRVRDTAVSILEHLEEAHAHLENHAESRDQVLYRFRQLHREARRRNDQVALTAYTLVIIQLRAEALGTAGGPALEAIGEFTGHWAHAVEKRQPSDAE